MGACASLNDAGQEAEVGTRGDRLGEGRGPQPKSRSGIQEVSYCQALLGQEEWRLQERQLSKASLIAVVAT